MSWLFRKSQAHAEVKSGSVPSAAKNHSHAVLLLGDAGAGKSTLINCFTNFFLGGSLTEPLVAIPTQFHRASSGTTNNSKIAIIQDQNKSIKCTTYSFGYQGRQFHFTDAPGLGTAGSAEWDKNFAGLLKAAEQPGALSAIVVTIDGRAARATLSLRSMLSRMRVIVPAAILSNLIVVLTNCKKNTSNFDFKTLDQPWEINPENVFTMDNSAFNYNPSEWRSNSVFANEMTETWYASMEEIKNLVYTISDLDMQSQIDPKMLPNYRDNIKSGIQQVLLEMNKLQNVQDRVENAPQIATKTPDVYNRFKHGTEVEFVTLVDTNTYNRLCIIHTESVCHGDCPAGDTTAASQRRCHCMSGPRCRVCDCDHSTHFCTRKTLKLEHQTIASILQSLHNAGAKTTNMSNMAEDLQLLHQSLRQQELRIEHYCYRLKNICGPSDFGNETYTIFTAMDSKARALSSTNARQDAYKMIQSITEMIDRMNGNSRETIRSSGSEIGLPLSSPQLGQTQQAVFQNEPKTSQTETYVCQRFNKNLPCDNHPCLFRHQCLLCDGHHSAVECRNNNVAAEPHRELSDFPPPYMEKEPFQPPPAENSKPQFLPGACRKFNSPNGCKTNNCRYAHICGYCSRVNHTAQQCRDPVRSNASTVSGASDSNSNAGSNVNREPASSNAPCKYFNGPKGCRNNPCKFAHICGKCFQSNHGVQDCRADDDTSDSDTDEVQSASTSKGQRYCKYFNRQNGCRNKNCKFAHICRSCSQPGHAVQDCPDLTDSSEPGPEDSVSNVAATSSKVSGPGKKDGTCKYYNSATGCRNQNCKFAHKCSTCGRMDHGASNCHPPPVPVKAKPNAKQRPAQPRPNVVITIQSSSVEVADPKKFVDGSCYEFNRGKPCRKTPCKYKHLCGICGQLHSAVQHSS
ncbi:uncharacterized protein LOC129587462 isoform X2 [Paramacrobiotus metropolitanus]|nr:uncharacterized protein LOC129587462 isoform X2 [Paramacrobiotus metropolitanus]